MGLLATVLELSQRSNPDNKSLNYQIYEGYCYSNVLPIGNYTSKLHPIDFCIMALYSMGYNSNHKIFINHGEDKPKELVYSYGYVGKD